MPHLTTAHLPPGAKARVHFDYLYMGLPGELIDVSIGSSKLPILAIKEDQHKCVSVFACPAKGVSNEYGGRKLLEFLKWLGFSELVLKCDQEPSTKALLEFAQQNFRGHIVPELSPKGESKRNGIIERYKQEVQGIARTIKDYLEAMCE